MNNNRNILNDSGFSLIQVMIVGAMMVGMAVVGMKIAENQTKSTKGAQQNSEATTFFSLISSIMSGKQACTNTFMALGNQVPAMDPSRTNPPYSYNQPIKDASTNPVGGNDLFQAGTTYGVINFIGMDIYNTSFDLTQLATRASGLLEVKLKFRREASLAAGAKRTTYGASEFVRTMHLFVNMNDDGTFKDCYDITEGITDTIAISICEDIGGDYDPINRRCDPARMFQENAKLICESMEFYWDPDEESCQKYVRGGHYGGCSKELYVDTAFKGTYNEVWPILNCSTNPPTCDESFKAVQLGGGLVNVTPFGELRAEMSTIWETWTCAKE